MPPNVEGHIRIEIEGDNSDGDNDGEYDDNDDDDGIKIRRVSHIRTVTPAFYDNRPLHYAPLPAVRSAPLASDPKRWLQPNPEVLSISCQKTCRCCVWSKPVYFKIGFGFGERKLTQRSKQTSETQDPVLII